MKKTSNSTKTVQGAPEVAISACTHRACRKPAPDSLKMLMALGLS